MFEKIRALELLPHTYVVIGSAVLAAKYIREPRDIDILVHHDQYDLFRSKGWEAVPATDQQHKLRQDDIELHKTIHIEERIYILADLIPHAEIIHGIPFLKLSELIRIKKARARPKDLDDLALIDRYLAERH